MCNRDSVQKNTKYDTLTTGSNGPIRDQQSLRRSRNPGPFTAADASIWCPPALAKSKPLSDILQHATLYLGLAFTLTATIVYSIYWQLPSTSAVRLLHPLNMAQLALLCSID
jgi:hypothetical protein